MTISFGGTRSLSRAALAEPRPRNELIETLFRRLRGHNRQCYRRERDRRSMTIGTAIVVVAAVYFLIVSPGFRMVAGAIAAGAIVLLLWLTYRSNESSREWNQQRQATESLAPTEIKSQELALADVKMERSSWAVADNSSLDEWVLTGTVTNNSKHSLGRLTFEITVLDCPLKVSPGSTASDVNCRTVGQRQQETSANVPAGQTRAFSSNAIRFPDMPALDRRYQRKF
jgi:hypothetical protein